MREPNEPLALESWDWMPEICRALESAPEPERALRLAEGILTTPLPGTDESLATQLAARSAGNATSPADIERLARILMATCGIAPFLAAQLRLHPQWLLTLMDDDLETPRDDEQLHARITAALHEADDSSLDSAPDPASTLRQFKYFELMRLTIRDACPEWVPLDESAITLAEISALADVILGSALEIASERIEAQLGTARWRTESGDSIRSSFCVLGLGKLGSEELNYSSDVDLVYIYETPPGSVKLGGDDEGHQTKFSPLDYFSRLAQAFGKIMSTSTGDGFLYRVDLDLRPEGAQGAIVVGHEAFATYYEAWADTWERAAFMKARPVAGDVALGWRAIRQVAPMIYHSSMDYAGVESIRALKQKVEATHGQRSGSGTGDSTEGWNVKIDSGGIRDVEFIGQALQLLHGGRIDQIRERGTQRSLRRLAEVGLLPADKVATLLDAYRFLRRTENRIQMEGEQQRHRIPREGPAMLRLARAMGFLAPSAVEDFSEELGEKRAAVQALFSATYATGGSERILELFSRNVPHLMAAPGMGEMLTTLAEAFAHYVDESPEPQLALNNLDRFIEGVGGGRFYYELLLDRPELIPRLASLFGASRYLSSFLASHPRLIEPVFADPDVLVLTRDELRSDLDATLDEATGGDEDATEEHLDALRVFQHRQVLNVGLLDIGRTIDRAAAELGLSDLAEVCLEEGLVSARHSISKRAGWPPEAAERGAYLVVGMGKLGSRELTYGSDLDLIFLYDLLEEDSAATAEAQDFFVRLTQRLISALQTTTGEGFCYEVDARLRPSGNQGTLVTSLTAFQRYHDEKAEVWERQALLRARPVAGDARLAERFDEIRQGILTRPREGDPAAEIASIRQRMQDELAKETQQKRNFKTGRGGLLDIETIVQYLQLLHGAKNPELLTVQRLEDQLASLTGLGHLSEQHAEALTEGWEFLQMLGNRLRIVENRSISDLDSERGNLDSLARALGYEDTGREGGNRRALLRDYRHHTERIRAIYEEILRP